MPRTRRSAVTSCHGGRRASKHEDSRAHGGHRYSSTSDARGWMYCTKGSRRTEDLDLFRRDGRTSRPPFKDDVVVENGAAALKSCLPSLEMRSPTAPGGLRPTSEASIATMTTYNQPPLRLYSTEETDSKKTNLRTPILYVLYDSSFLPDAPSCRRVIETKLGENCIFDPGGSRSSPRLPVYGNVTRVALW